MQSYILMWSTWRQLLHFVSRKLASIILFRMFWLTLHLLSQCGKLLLKYTSIFTFTLQLTYIFIQNTNNINLLPWCMCVSTYISIHFDIMVHSGEKLVGMSVSTNYLCQCLQIWLSYCDLHCCIFISCITEYLCS